MYDVTSVINLKRPTEMSSKNSAVVDRISAVLEKISTAEKRSLRSPGSVTLIAVSKTKSAEMVLAASQSGIRDFGENYVQESLKKIERMTAVLPQAPLRWHLIGALQTNKSKFVVGRFETIQSVDRFDLAKALDTRAQEAGVIQNVLVQVKLGDEPTKGGVLPSHLSELIGKMSALKNLRLEGLMCLPPMDLDPEASRKYFIQLRKLKEEMAVFVPVTQGGFKHLSMGTTHDYEVAIEEGATMVRVGTALFGARDT